MYSSFQNINVCGIETVVPIKKINIDNEINYFDSDPKKLSRTKKILGLGTRHIVDEGTTAIDLCYAAASDLLEQISEPLDNIEVLILVNQSPAYLHPAGACMLQNMLGIPQNCAAFDVNLGCSGYVYGLWLAHNFIASGACQNVLLCAGDTPSIHSSIANRKHNPIFGDAGSATLLKKGNNAPAFFALRTDGTGWDKIIIPGGGARLRPDKDFIERNILDQRQNPWRLFDDLIQGKAVFEFSVTQVPELIHSILQFAHYKLSDLDFFAIHQANRQIILEICSRLELPKKLIYTDTFTRYGNQSTASVVGVLCDALNDKMNNNNLRILLCGFGVGFSLAAAILSFENCFNAGIKFYTKPKGKITPKEEIEHWKNIFLND